MWCAQTSFDNLSAEKNGGCNWQHQYLCFRIATWNICVCNTCFEAYDQIIYSFISLTNENKNCKEDSHDSNNLQEPHDSDDNVTADGDFFSKNDQRKHVWSNDSGDFIGVRDSPDVDHDDISKANY